MKNWRDDCAVRLFRSAFATVDRQLGDLLGQKYIELSFGADVKARIT